jgi:DNA-directed RNA polymerase
MDRILGTVEEQLILEKLKEEEGVHKVVRTIRNAISKGNVSDTVYGQVLVKLGYEAYVNKLNAYMETEFTNHDSKPKDLLLLMSDNMEAVAFTVLTNVVNGAACGNTLSYIAMNCVRNLRDIFLFNKLKSDNPKLHTYLGQKFRRANKRKKKELLDKHIKNLYTLGKYDDDNKLMLRLGTTLINLLELSGANIIEVRKELVSHNKTQYLVRLTEEASKIIRTLDITPLTEASINKLPMIVPPKDWVRNKGGGFLTGRNSLFTTRSKDVNIHLHKHRLDKVYPIINRLQQTAWRVNTEVLAVVKHIFDSNMIDPKSPTLSPYLYGELPTRDGFLSKELINQEDYATWHEYNRAREDVDIRSNADASKRIDLLFTLAVAEKMKKYATLYFPYELDYRGRVYSKVNFLSPQGQAHTKAMMEFSEARHLDEQGEFWLKVHIANCYGLDKEEFDVRTDWVESQHDMLLDIATHPLDNISYWAWSDSPFEFLASCFAYRDYVGGKAVRLPIQLDATCSGIQMYSGLLRDREGAEAVNVIGNNRNDIYQIVADKVNDTLTSGNYNATVIYKDKEGEVVTLNGSAVGKSMAGNITRAIVKRNVMTVPYSVTKRGMSNQLWDKMDEATLKGKEFWQGDKFVANKILTGLNEGAIYDTIKGAKKGQNYLVEVAKLQDEPATWKGVLYDFPIRQTALDLSVTQVQTPYGRLALNVETPDLNRRRQRNSIAPNFVHNIDSTILMFCVEAMSTNIGVIHDCFLVHPNDGDEIQECYKEGFITVMSLDPLRSFQEQLDPTGEVDFPEYGELELLEVRESNYIIS